MDASDRKRLRLVQRKLLGRRAVGAAFVRAQQELEALSELAPRRQVRQREAATPEA